MNPKWVGDSYDIVKRFFAEQLNEIGYRVVVDPMLTGKWDGLEDQFYKFLNVNPSSEKSDGKSALLLDPDTGVGRKRTKKHITIEDIADQLLQYEIVFAFDQSFSSRLSEKYPLTAQ